MRLLAAVLFALVGAACSNCVPGPAPCPLEPLSGPEVHLTYADGGPAASTVASISVLADGGPDRLRAYRLDATSGSPFVVSLDLQPIDGEYRVQIVSDAGVGTTAPFRVTGSTVTGMCDCGQERRMALLDVDGGVPAIIP